MIYAFVVLLVLAFVQICFFICVISLLVESKKSLDIIQADVMGCYNDMLDLCDKVDVRTVITTTSNENGWALK